MEEIGLDKLNFNFLPIALSWVNVQLLLTSPRGARPPLFMLNFGFGIKSSLKITEEVPRPVHDKQAP